MPSPRKTRASAAAARRTRSQPSSNSNSATGQRQRPKKKTTSNNHTPQTPPLTAQRDSHSPQPVVSNTSNPLDDEEDIPPANRGQDKNDHTFVSRFPGLDIDDFESHVDDWTVAGLQGEIEKQDSRSTKAHSEIKALVKRLRLDYEKKILMACLMGNVPEAVLWKLV